MKEVYVLMIDEWYDHSSCCGVYSTERLSRIELHKIKDKSFKRDKKFDDKKFKESSMITKEDKNTVEVWHSDRHNQSLRIIRATIDEDLLT